jgi:hypothetical protein
VTFVVVTTVFEQQSLHVLCLLHNEGISRDVHVPDCLACNLLDGWDGIPMHCCSTLTARVLLLLLLLLLP